MKARLSFILTLVLALGYIQVFAADITAWTVSTQDNANQTTDLTAWDAWVQNNNDGTANVKAGDVNVTGPSVKTADNEILPADWAWDNVPLNAASWKDVIVAPKMWIGNYPEVACDKDFFTSNSCGQCFDWGKKMAWEKIAWLTDSWTNPNSTEQVIYKDEQKMPEFVNLGWEGTKWLSNPTESDKFYKFADDVVWNDSATWSGKQEFLLESWKTVGFLEADLWASYALESSDKKEWDAIWLLKFNIAYHDTDASAKESEMKTHTECVAYYAWKPAPVAPIAQTPAEATKVKTWPETIVLLIAALFLSFVFIKYRKKA